MFPDRQIIRRDAAGTNPAVITPPAIGDYWRGQGGLYAGVVRSNSGAQWHLIMHKNTLSMDFWGHQLCLTEATSRHDGLANTQKMRSAKRPSPLVKQVSIIESEGHNDWYLPAQFELNLLCVNLNPKLLPKWHFSSTEHSPHEAWVQDLGNGAQSISEKNVRRAARAVRRILI